MSTPLTEMTDLSPKPIPPVAALKINEPVGKRTSHRAYEGLGAPVYKSASHRLRLSEKDAMFKEDSYLQAPESLVDVVEPCNSCRITLSLVLVVGAAAFSYFVDAKDFAIWLPLPNTPTLRACVDFCESTQTDTFSDAYGYKGLCNYTKADNASLKFSHCDFSGASKLKACTRVYDIDLDLDHLDLNKTHGMARKCEFKVVRPAWKPLTAVVVFTFCIVLVIQGVKGEVVLLGGAAFLSLLDILPRKDVFKGVSNSGVISLGVLFPIAAAIEETGLLENAIGVVLGAPKTMNSALLRLMLCVAIVSAFLSNTATVALMIPIVLTWARRLDVHPGKMLMPLSFAAQLGGSMTVLGSSHCLVAKAVVAKGYNMGFFDLFPVGLLIMLIMTFVIIPLAGTSFLKSSGDTSKSSEAVEEEDAYKLTCVVNKYGGISEKTIEDSGLRRIQGLLAVKLDKTDSEAVEEGEHALQAGDTLLIWANPAGIMSIRRQAGVDLVAQVHLNRFGGSRRTRHLYEVTVAWDSEFMKTDILNDDRALLKDLGAVFLAGPQCPPGQEPEAIKAGDVLIFEAEDRFIDETAGGRWTQACSQIAKLPGTSPPMSTSGADQVRSAVVGLGMVLLIGASSIKATGIKLDTGGTMFILLLLMIGALTLRKLFSSIRYDILLIIAGALAMGEVLQQNGVVNFISDNLLRIAKPGGPVGIIVAVYALAVILSMFINNSATIAILGPLLISIAEQDPQANDIKVLTWTMVFAAGSCFTTPLGYQTNLMVMPPGKYSFGDFARFGAAIQLVHMVVTVALVYTLGDTLPPSPLDTGRYPV